MKPAHAKSLVLGALAVVLLPGYALADPHHGWNDHRWPRGHEAEQVIIQETPAPTVRVGETVYVIADSDKREIREYIGKKHHHRCPPGLAKKRHSCVPPGHARYVIGQPLPQDVVYVSAPRVIVKKLSPAPVGYRYVQVDKDILLMNEATKKIVDAVTLLSAIGN